MPGWEYVEDISAYRVLISFPLILDSIGKYSDKFAGQDIEYDIAEVDQHIPESELLDLIGHYHEVLAGEDNFTEDVLGPASNLEVGYRHRCNRYRRR